ncbi:uncharacterized protein B0J16DRAFT_47331 [Fusarium flagelliforme]|uniref:uncharacterized protein n=1 Tax=Fusarium flagelliforme TaxID=2675880 RepID=UPI001E8DAF43|nr:uncharacterized protein B0J16DRAFT_47331 [Fusarium flagelliforme]KAH7198885.1 hypothetical protein B0J16DRAFT_47331 [Fusarium flagelliforme]
MVHRRVKHCHRPLDPAPPVGAIPMIRRHTISRIPRYPTKQKVESLDFAEEEDNGFPCFCMRCEKEFIPRDHQLLYCSQGCRNLDQEGHPVLVTPPQTSSKIAANLPFYSAAIPKPRDIVPCALPSRPTIGLLTSNVQAKSTNNVTTGASSITSESLLYI